MKIGIPREVLAGERRVAVTPEVVRRLREQLGFEVLVECGAGERASFPDAHYEEAGARLLGEARALWAESDVVLKVQPPMEHPRLGVHEADLLREGGTLIGFLWPARNEALLERLAARDATAFAMDRVPRITRAQKMDALSSMANIAGYRAVIEAAASFGRFFTGQVTAAGKVPPAQVLVIGAGVAGLAAIGAARGLGAVVRAFDVRASVREQIESMGARFLSVSIDEDLEGEGGYARAASDRLLRAERDLFESLAPEVDIVVTTAMVPGKPAPRLLTEAFVSAMKPGSVIVDLAAEAGGNCELTVPGDAVERHGVHVIGYTDMPSRLAPTASQLYGTNLYHLLDELGGAEGWHVDPDDEVIRGTLVLEGGTLRWPPPKPERRPVPVSAEGADRPAQQRAVPARREEVSGASSDGATSAEATSDGAGGRSRGGWRAWLTLAVALALAGVGWAAPPGFLSHLTVFVLAVFVGWQVVWNVTPALHTPLMSVTNAISGIILIGGMLQLGGGDWSRPSVMLGAAAVLVATINVAGGFLVTRRMLEMFRREETQEGRP